MAKLGGVGLVNMMVIAIFTLFFFVAMKTVFTMYHVNGLSEIVQAA